MRPHYYCLECVQVQIYMMRNVTAVTHQWMNKNERRYYRGSGFVIDLGYRLCRKPGRWMKLGTPVHRSSIIHVAAAVASMSYPFHGNQMRSFADYSLDAWVTVATFLPARTQLTLDGSLQSTEQRKQRAGNWHGINTHFCKVGFPQVIR